MTKYRFPNLLVRISIVVLGGFLFFFKGADGRIVYNYMLYLVYYYTR